MSNTETKAAASWSRPSASGASAPASIDPLGQRPGPRRARRPISAARARASSRTSAAGTTRSASPMPQGLVGADLATGEDHVLGPAHAHQAGQALGGPAAGDDAEQDLGLAETGVVGHHPQVAGQGQLEPPPRA